ncbi:phytanoyl-CoA dioxygenase family protein [Haloplanus aerogenes]|uniref:Phytanoyl-CoA dioxygenase PhyH n=1 Tax=Haloplanus aerogenes TaxID=660522 RepID=A0A3M0D946_9EURY|nr:hypothetical protein [Haloplanus aerogenes]AZH26329.1 hypothetical protein DU502_13570 [Haloplanus aerogenes]RMB18212.1 hypothetical protein ATH50_1662 [Haloplanus aerogenes]
MLSTAQKVVNDPMSVVRFARTMTKRADYRLGRDVFGHSNKLSSSLAGNLAIKRAQLSGSNGQSSIQSEARRLREAGIAELGQPYDQSTISEIKSRFDEIIGEKSYTYTRGANGTDYSFGIDSTTFDLAEEFPAVANVVTSDILEVLHGYYGTWTKPIRVNMWRNHHVPPEVVESSEVFSNYWHTDPHTTDHVKLFVYLTDVDENNGPFHAVSTADSLSITNDYKRSRDGVPNGRVRAEAREIHKFTGPAGSAALCNTNTNLHRAGIPAEGNHRDLLQVVFAPSSEPLGDDWIEDRESYAFEGSDHDGLRRLFRY